MGNVDGARVCSYTGGLGQAADEMREKHPGFFIHRKVIHNPQALWITLASKKG